MRQINNKISKDLMVLIEHRIVNQRSYANSKLFIIELKVMTRVYSIRQTLRYMRRYLKSRIYLLCSFIAHTFPFIFKTRYYKFWSRDCDLCESTRVYTFPSKYHADDFEDEQYEWAEGPQSMEEVSKQEYMEFQPSFRDRVMEAYENGNGRCVII
jgi:type I site-specific restriction endonuclease